MSILKTNIIVCDNEHGFGDVTFPELSTLTTQNFQLPLKPVWMLRREAKAAGWGRVERGDYCPGCMESM